MATDYPSLPEMLYMILLIIVMILLGTTILVLLRIAMRTSGMPRRLIILNRPTIKRLDKMRSCHWNLQ